MLVVAANQFALAHFIAGDSGTDTLTVVKNNYRGATTLDLRLATVTSIEALGFVNGTKLVLNSSQFGGTGISLSSQVATEAGGAATLQS